METFGNLQFYVTTPNQVGTVVVAHRKREPSGLFDGDSNRSSKHLGWIGAASFQSWSAQARPQRSTLIVKPIYMPFLDSLWYFQYIVICTILIIYIMIDYWRVVCNTTERLIRPKPLHLPAEGWFYQYASSQCCREIPLAVCLVLDSEAPWCSLWLSLTGLWTPWNGHKNRGMKRKSRSIL